MRESKRVRAPFPKCPFLCPTTLKVTSAPPSFLLMQEGRKMLKLRCRIRAQVPKLWSLEDFSLPGCILLSPPPCFRASFAFPVVDPRADFAAKIHTPEMFLISFPRCPSCHSWWQGTLVCLRTRGLKQGLGFTAGAGMMHLHPVPDPFRNFRWALQHSGGGCSKSLFLDCFVPVAQGFTHSCWAGISCLCLPNFALNLYNFMWVHDPVRQVEIYFRSYDISVCQKVTKSSSTFGDIPLFSPASAAQDSPQAVLLWSVHHYQQVIGVATIKQGRCKTKLKEPLQLTIIVPIIFRAA